jgi:hypothetical protein
MFKGHSFRIGGAQSLLKAGVSVDDIKMAGRWKSHAVQSYLRAPSVTAAVASKAFNKVGVAALDSAGAAINISVAAATAVQSVEAASASVSAYMVAAHPAPMHLE